MKYRPTLFSVFYYPPSSSPLLLSSSPSRSDDSCTLCLIYCSRKMLISNLHSQPALRTVPLVKKFPACYTTGSLSPSSRQHTIIIMSVTDMTYFLHSLRMTYLRLLCFSCYFQAFEQLLVSFLSL